MASLFERANANLGALTQDSALARDVAAALALGPSSEAESDIQALLSAALYSAISKSRGEEEEQLSSTAKVQDAADFINTLFEALSESSAAQEDDQPGENEGEPEKPAPKAPQHGLAELAPSTPAQWLQFALLDVVWAIDSSFESAPSLQPWPAPKDATLPLQELSPQRYALREFLALIRVRFAAQQILRALFGILSRSTLSFLWLRHTSRCRFRSSVLLCMSPQTQPPRVASFKARSGLGPPCCPCRLVCCFAGVHRLTRAFI